jgi:phosphonate transport system substrate-binding protein
MAVLQNGLRWIHATVVVLLALGLGGCGDETHATGTNGGPSKLVMAFQPQEDVTKLEPNAMQLVKYLEGRVGCEVRHYMPTDYTAVVEALRGKQADIAYFSAWPCALAETMADVEVFAAEKRTEGPFYWSQWYVLADSPYRSLADLKGKKVAFTSQTSTSGFLFPYAKLIEEGVLPPRGDPKSVFADVLFAGGYEQALKALVAGQVEAAAASDYAFPRYLKPEEQARVRVIAKQGPVPSHCLAYRKALPEATKAKIREAFLALNEEANRELLKKVYGAEGLVAVDGNHLAGLKKALEQTGVATAIDRFKVK